MDYSRFDWAWVVIAVMTAWTAGTTVAYARPERRPPVLLGADLLVTAGLLLSTFVLQYPHAMRHGVMPVTGIWVAGPVLAWAVRYGRRAGTVTALLMSGCDFVLRHGDITVVLNGVVLLLLAGVTIGHVARLAAEVETERQHAAAVEAASRERERLARDIHDSVLQVLALVQRRGAEAGDDVDLSALVLRTQAEGVTVSVPAQAVRLEKTAAEELASAVRAALDNVRRHCGERAGAWVLVEDEPGLVTVTVRDDGPGIPDGRLAAAPASGEAAALQLTERETEILRMVATGLSYKQIAGRLVLSHRTVQNHVQNTLGKLQLHNRVELVRYAIEHGLADEPQLPGQRSLTRLSARSVVTVRPHSAARRKSQAGVNYVAIRGIRRTSGSLGRYNRPCKAAND